MPQSPPPGPDLDYGPSGYLPERASKRARKIVLRAPLGLQWVIASIVAGVVLLVAGIVFLTSAGAVPDDPWMDVGAVATVGTTHRPAEIDVLVVHSGSRVRAFSDADGVIYCAASNRLEHPDGRVWALTGRGAGGVDSLPEHPTLVTGERIYVDPTTTAPALSPSQTAASPQCASG